MLLADSLLTLTLSQSIIKANGRLDQQDLREQFARLLESPEFLASGPGAICLATMRCIVDDRQSGLDCFKLDDLSIAVRSFPLGCLPGPPRTEAVIDLAAAQCQSAFSHHRVTAAACVIADSISFLVGGGPLTTEEQVRSFVKKEIDLAARFDQSFADAFDGVAPDLDYARPACDLPYSLINVESNVAELIPTAFGIFLIYRQNLEEAICAAALAGGDTDTVAFLVGALAGACHGGSKIPDRWLNGIAHKDRLEEVAESLARFWN
jgi:ADP-ribosylglycohydrolase